MENNDAENFDSQQNAVLILRWLQGGNPHASGGEGDTTTNFEGMFSNDQLQRITEGGDFSDENYAGMFRRMRIVYQYEASRETLEHYSSVREQLEEVQPEEIMTISDLDSLGRPETSIYGSSYFLSSSYSSSENQPSSTDSDVYKVSSSSSDCNNEILKIHEPTVSVMDNIKHESSSSVSDSSNEIPANPNPLEDNLLLRACILDLNDVPMTAAVSQIANQMIQILFNQEEIAILRNFIRYRIRVTIEEINQRLIALTMQQNEVLTTLESMPSDSQDGGNDSDDYQELSSFESDEPDDPLGVLFQNSDSTQETEIAGEVNNHGAQNIQSHEPVQETIHEAENQREATIEDNNCNDEMPPDAHEESSILLDEESWESGGRTARSVDIMNDMIPLSSEERERLLRQRRRELSEDEHSAVLQFMDAAEDSSRPVRQGFWRRLRARMQATRSSPRPRERRSSVLRWRRHEANPDPQG